jgi:murein DD-endopeptidase MepM/ murein hydrolase activator NlpD
MDNIEKKLDELTAEVKRLNAKERHHSLLKIAIMLILFNGGLMFCGILTGVALKVFNPPTRIIPQTPQTTQPLNSLHYIAGSKQHGNGLGTITLGEDKDSYYYGIDYIRPCGSPIYAPFTGTLTYLTNIGGNTPLLILKDETREVSFMHMSPIVSQGDVTQGTLIATTNKLGDFANNTCHDHVSY